MSRGDSQRRTLPGRRTLERCKSKGSVENVEIIDVDKGKSDVVIIEVPESSHRKSRCFRVKERDSYASVISIDDEEEGIDENLGNVRYAATSSTFRPFSSNSPLSKESDSDECLIFVGERTSPSKFTGKVKMHPKCGSSRNRYGLDPASDGAESDSSGFCTSEGGSSESDNSDCEIMEDASGEIREQWERAALRRKMSQRSQFGSEDQASASGSSADPGFQSDQATQNMVYVESINESDKEYSKYFGEVPGECGPSSSSNGKNSSSRMANADELTEDSLQGIKENNSAANSVPSTGISHDGLDFQKEELISDECSHRAQSSDETYFNCKNNCFQDFKMEDSVCVRDGHFDFLDKDEQIPVDTCYGTAEPKGETIFQDVVTPYSGVPHKASDGNVLFSDSVGLQDRKEHAPEEQPSCHTQSPVDPMINHEIAAQEKEDKKEHCPGEQPSCQTQLPHDSVVDHELAAQVKKKLCPERTVLFNDPPTDKQQNDFGNQSICHSKEGTLEEPICNPHAESGATGICTLFRKPDLSHIQNGLIWGREKHKESDEYRRADEEEWASRQRVLQIQAEEAQRLRKKRKAENSRLMEMEKRQKQRLEEIRELQKKDEEIIHLKEKLRAEVRKELDKMEGRYRDMASLLRGLGIHVEGGPFPLSHEVNAAYKQALLKFHPDRASRTDIRRQVEAEETFKLISRLKEQLQPVA
uniref:Uncharacterized protein LOC105033203 n=1 Tax=Elaeis guineensis var. tenera TaxID=51953 RepID=A0A6I9QAQ5_ELAGV|nr:uncharacterized protein LOC105033203 [Elaeis guineensis]XP_010906191.1 uncharacterized protein LOC105033203 [Elaeis guineensis]XP_019702134.1 uncharacterized protein LOC105033203 [Elaeis guineensis]